MPVVAEVGWADGCVRRPLGSGHEMAEDGSNGRTTLWLPRSLCTGFGIGSDRADRPVPRPVGGACRQVPAVVVRANWVVLTSGTKENSHMATVMDGDLQSPGLQIASLALEVAEMDLVDLSLGPLVVCAGAGCGRHRWGFRTTAECLGGSSSSCTAALLLEKAQLLPLATATVRQFGSMRFDPRWWQVGIPVLKMPVNAQ